MTLRVGASIGDFGRLVDVFIVDEDEHGDATRIMRIDEEGVRRWEDIPQGVTVRPTLSFNREEAEKLADELGFVLGGKAATRLLRKDLDVERQRVDALIKGLLDKPQIIVTSGEVRTR